VCVSHAESSLREREFRSVTAARRRTASIRTPSHYQVLTRGEGSIGPIDSSLEAEFAERRKSERPGATSAVREVL